MNLKKIIINSLLLAIGLILHQVAPPLLFGMKPDILLTMMFITILISKDYKLAVIISIASGILTAATTTFPGGQIPNVIDKLVTGQIVYLMFKITDKKLNNQFQMALVSVIGTVISGTIFLGSAFYIFGLPAPFSILMYTVVLPATIVNTLVGVILYNSIQLALKRTAY
ncbi:tryptophan transporter [Clostridium sp. BSD9I1]|uniref:tryptophan transporter n=1 Tax=Clostridium sp. BSD9I1 TaxID=2003589 RepID=UPI0016452510|nr:tryptophan transporter [Clostridium sp. BSD9I1]